MGNPSLTLEWCREDKKAYGHGSVEACRKDDPKQRADSHPTHRAENLAVHDEERNLNEEKGWWSQDGY